MRILQVTSHLDVGGIPRYVLTLSEQLAHRGHQVMVASDGGQLEARMQERGMTHWRLPLHTSAEFSLRVFSAFRQLMERLRREPVDLLHAHTRVAQVVAHAVFRRLGIPYVTTWHGIYTPRLGRRLWPCLGERTMAISGQVAEHLRQAFHVPASRVRLVYNGIDTDYYAHRPEAATIQAWRRRWHLPDGQPVIGGIGRCATGRVKGFDLILVAACALKTRFPELHVLLVGDGPRRPFLEDVAKRLGLHGCVHFVGAVNDVRVPLALLDVFVFPSRWPEAFGLTLVEAMAAGKAVVATSHGAVSEILQHDVQGWIVPPNDPSAMADSIQGLLQHRAVAARLGQAAQARARGAFDVGRMVTEIEAVYREVVSHPGDK